MVSQPPQADDPHLRLQIGKDDGFKLSAEGRFNFSSGKGALSADLSYPLHKLWPEGPDLYLFGEGFVGYGEDLLDYNRRATALRFGAALVR